MVTSTVDITLVVMDPIDPIVQPVAVSQPLSQVGPSRFATAYPWGMPHTYNPQFATSYPFMPYQSFAAVHANVNSAAFSWGMPNPYSTQGVEIEETHTVDSTEDQEPEYRGPHLNFHIYAPPVQPNPYAYASRVPQFPNNIALQYAHYGAPLAPNMYPGGQIAQEGTPAALTLNLVMVYQMFPQVMPPPMSAQNVVQPPPRVSTQRVP